MPKEGFVLNRKGVNELLRSEEMRQVVEQYGRDVQNRAGEGYDTRTHMTEQRVIVNVFPATEEAAVDNYENNTLLKAVGR